MDDNELRRRLYVPNFEHWRSMCVKDYYSAEEPSVQTVERGIILPAQDKKLKDAYRFRGGVCDKDMKFVAGYSNIAPGKKNGWCCIDEGYKVDRKTIIQSSEEVIWGGALICHFGHFITESMSRMWYVAEHPEDQRKVVFERVNTWKLDQWIYDFFDLLGLSKDRIIVLDKATQFAKIVVPDQAWRIKYNHTNKFLVPFRKMVSSVTPIDGPKKIFLTRSKELKTQMYLANQDYFEEFYRAHGYEIVAPEKLSASEQIALITGADEVATHMGTLAHWTLFCREGAKWTFLNRVDDFSTRQCMIDKAVGIDWYIVSASMNFMHSDQGGGVCLIGPTEYWRRFVQDQFGEKISDDDARVPAAVFSDYVDHWCRYFVKPDHMKTRLKTIKKLYARMTLLEARLQYGRPILCCEAHSARKGWMPVNIEGDVCGTIDEKKSLQALKIYFSEPFCNVTYAVYYPTEGWTKPTSNGAMAGTTGRDKAIYGVNVRLDHPDLEVRYRIHNFNGHWSPWHRDGAKLVSLEHALDAVQIRLAPRRVKQ